jgi:IS1 family transposase
MRGMNKLPLAKRAQILTLLCEGSSMRSIERIVGCSINTVDKLLRAVGEVALAYHDENVRGVKAQRVQCDEIWSFVHAKAKNAPKSKRAGDPTIGDCWTWTAIDADSKLLLSYLVGSRDAEFALMLMDDLRQRLVNRVQLTTDGHRAYLQAVEDAFGADIAMRMAMRRFTRLTNAFSKKLENHAHMVALYALWYNFVRIHKTLRVSPAIAAGIETRLWSMDDVVRLIEQREDLRSGALLVG